MNISSCIEPFRGKTCWSVIAGSGTGSVVKLGFGGKKLKSKPLTNPLLEDDERIFDPEVSIVIYCGWRLSKSDKIICGWRDSNEISGDMLSGLNLLKDKKVIDYQLGKIGFDLDIYFDEDICIQLFCDQTNDYESDENYTLFVEHAICTVGLKGCLEFEERK